MSPALHEELCDDIEAEEYFVFIDESTAIWPISNNYSLQFAITVRGTKHFIVSLHFYTTPVEGTGFGVFLSIWLIFEWFGILPIMTIWQP